MQNPVISDLCLLLGSCAYQFSFMVFHNCCLKFSEQKQKLSYFELLQYCPKAIRVMTLNLCYQGKHVKETNVLNYASPSENGLGTKVISSVICTKLVLLEVYTIS